MNLLPASFYQSINTYHPDCVLQHNYTESMPINLNHSHLILGDSIKVLKQLPDNCADVFFCDPPYNLQLNKPLLRPDQSNVEGVSHDWDKFSSYADYDAFCKEWLMEIKRVLKPTGTIWVIGSYHNIFRIGALLQDLGFWILNDIIWRKSNPMPNFKGTRFTNAHETLLWASVSKESKYYFNYHALKQLNDDKQMRSDWYLPICSGHERLKTETGDTLHPTQKPESLLFRVLLASTKENDLVIDPFFGTGTTGAVAKRLKRRFIGIDSNQDYINYASTRIDLVVPLKGDLSLKQSKKEAVRVPFGDLIQANLIAPGETLYSKDKQHKAEVTLDGYLYNPEWVGMQKGSIHQLAAKCNATTSYNGWDFWYKEVKGELVSIDSLRNQLRDYQSTPLQQQA